MVDKEDNGKKNKSGGSRNSEKRRERSKVAARCRRGKESEIFQDLASCLPLPESLRKSLDKASVARLALTHLKLNYVMSEVFGSSVPEEAASESNGVEYDQFLNEAMGGFVFVLSADGDLEYISESVTKCLGLSQCEVMGQSIFDFTHPCDHEDIKDMLSLKRNQVSKENGPITRGGFFRMKCTITSKGRNVHLRAASYKGISCNGRLFWTEKDPKARWYAGVGEPLSDPTDVNFPLNKQAFVTRHSMDMKVEDVGGNVTEFLGYQQEDLVGKTFYDFTHAADGASLSKNVKDLYSKGQIQTERYRFLAKNGGWVWCVTQATVLKSETGAKTNGIVCLHFVTSGIENEHEIVSVIQSKKETKISMESISAETEAIIHLPDIFPGAGFSNPTPSTAKIFAPRTEDMESGFLMPSDNTFIVSKDEPEDLTHLAPTAGEDCVPLCVPLLDDLLRSFDEANLSFTRDGNLVEVDANQFLPFFMMEEPRQDGSPIPSTNSVSLILCDVPSSPIDSPLFLQTDPQIVTPLIEPMLSSFTAPDLFQRSLVEEEGKLDERLRDLSDFPHLSSDWNEDLPSQSNGTTDKLHPFLEEMSEYRAPFIPTDGGEDIELLYALPDFNVWSPTMSPAAIDPALTINSCEPGSALIHTTVPVPVLNNCIAESVPLARPDSAIQAPNAQHPPKDLSKFAEQNIDQITWTLDIGSIFEARKPEDKPKVMTRSIFTSLDSPPLKVRKLAVIPGTPRPGVAEHSANASQLTSADIRKCPFLKSCRNLKRIGNGNSTAVNDVVQQLQTQSLNLKMENTDPVPCTSYLFRKRDVGGSLLQGFEGQVPTFYDLTQQDYETMVPLLDTSLLQGPDLLNALDSVTDVTAGGFIPNI